MVEYNYDVLGARNLREDLATDQHHDFRAYLVKNPRGAKFIVILPPKGEGRATWIPLSEDQCSGVERLVECSLENSVAETNSGKWRLVADTPLPDVLRNQVGAKAEIREGLVVIDDKNVRGKIHISVVSRVEAEQAVFALRVTRSSEQTSIAVEITINEVLFKCLYGDFVRQREVALSRESFSVPHGKVEVDRFERAGTSRRLKGVETYVPGAVMTADFNDPEAWRTFCSSVPRDLVNEPERYSHVKLSIDGLPKE
jgi:hypothetical protein